MIHRSTKKIVRLSCFLLIISFSGCATLDKVLNAISPEEGPAISSPQPSRKVPMPPTIQDFGSGPE